MVGSLLININKWGLELRVGVDINVCYRKCWRVFFEDIVYDFKKYRFYVRYVVYYIFLRFYCLIMFREGKRRNKFMRWLFFVI